MRLAIAENSLLEMHTLFTLKDLHGPKVVEIDGEICLRLDKSKDIIYVGILEMLSAWQEQSARLKAGEITKEEYDSGVITILNLTLHKIG